MPTLWRVNINPTLLYWLKLMLPWLLLVPILSSLLYQKLTEDALAPLYQEAESTLSSASKAITYHLGNIKRDALLLANHKLLTTALTYPSDANTAQVAEFFRAFSVASQTYDQIRWLDKNGNEKVRVNLLHGQAVIVSSAALQSKANRYYFQKSTDLVKNEFYVSPLDLNVELGQVEQPFKPVMRITTPLTSDQNGGLIVLNFLAQSMLDGLTEIAAKSKFSLSLLNQESYWLLAPNPNDAWGFMLSRPSARLSWAAPDAWKLISAQENGSFIINDGMWSFEKVQDLSNSHSPKWTLAVQFPSEQLDPIMLICLEQSLMVCALLWLLGGLVCWRLARAMQIRDQLHEDIAQQKQSLATANLALKESLAHLNETQQQLIESGKLSSLGMMVAGVAHELNTPVGASLVTLSSIEKECLQLKTAFDQGLKRSDVDRYFQHFETGADIIQANLRRAAALVSSFKRLAVDRTHEEQRHFHLTTLVEDMLHTSWLRHKQQSYNLTIAIDDDIEMNSYPGALGQVLENLVSNARLHAFEGRQTGDINITANVDTSGPIETVVLSVKDNGQGMSPEIQSHIFEPFFTTKRGNGGTGLGLHLVFQLVTQVLGGTILVNSNVNEGCEFVISMPRMAPKHGELLPNQARS